MQAIILAAGMGKRLKDLTKNHTKCMVKVNGITLIERMLNQLDALNLTRIVIVVGYEGKRLREYINTLPIHTPIEYLENPVYYQTNNIYSLSLAEEALMEEDTLLLESDLIFEDSVLKVLLQDKRETLALVDKYESWMDGTVVTLDRDDNIQAFIGGKKIVFEDIPFYYKTVNIYKFSRHFSRTYYVPFLEAYCMALGNNEYYEQVLRVITMLDEPAIQAKRLDGQLWYEIDDIQDLDIAESMFTDNEELKVLKLQQRYGGYWRYPKLLDYCYLVNPYFPPQRLIHEMKSNFTTLLTQYPSGMQVNSLLAAKNFGINQEYIVIGNGAAELIKSLMELIEGKIGFIKPTFEEYPNRYSRVQSVFMDTETLQFQYSAEDIIDFYSGKGISMLVLINPDNPSGNFLNRDELLTLCRWAEKENCSLLVDESFVDFAEGSNHTLIENCILEQYKNLIVVKSISKSYGVPGLRLGILVSSRKDLIGKIKKKVAIWNINSFAEFYMQIAEKYHGDYQSALDKLKEVRKKFITMLQQYNQLKVYPSQANFVMCELKYGITASELTKQLLVRHQILIKDLSSKIRNGRQLIRLAVRNEAENSILADALREELYEINRI